MRLQHTHVDVHGDIFTATGEVERLLGSIPMPEGSHFEGEALELEFHVEIRDGTEEWWVTVPDPRGIEMLCIVLREIAPTIELLVAPSAWVSLRERLEAEVKAEVERLAAEIEFRQHLLDADEAAVWDDRWQGRVRLPAGHGLSRLLEAWLRRGRFDAAEIEFLLWALQGRSKSVVACIAQKGSEVGHAFEQAILKVLMAEFAGSRGVAGWPSPYYRCWEQLRMSLADELAWLRKSD